MYNNDNVLKKLFKIAEKQQKIITKLAQTVIENKLWIVDPTTFKETLAPILGSLRGFPEAKVKTFNFYFDKQSQKLSGKISVPTEWFPTVLKTLKMYLPNRQIKISNADHSITESAVISNNIEITNDPTYWKYHKS